MLLPRGCATIAAMDKFSPTLAEALEAGDLGAFIEQAEAAGFGSADREKFEVGLAALTAPQQANRTSRSRARGGSAGK